jgi:LETM1 and EF-hand domain-containing protein 1
LILSRAFSFSDSKDLATPVEALQATLSSLPDSLLTETELHVSELEGAATPQQKLEVLEQQEELIADEKAQEEKEEKARKERKEEARLKKEAEEREKEKVKAQEQEATTAAAPVITTPAEVPLFDKSTPTAAAAGAPATMAGASELLTDAQVAAQVAKDAGATAATKELIDATASVEAAGTSILAEEEDKARMTEEQLLELREALCIMSSRSAVLEEREELEDLKEDRMEYKEVNIRYTIVVHIPPSLPPSLSFSLSLSLPLFFNYYTCCLCCDTHSPFLSFTSSFASFSLCLPFATNCLDMSNGYGGTRAQKSTPCPMQLTNPCIN